MEKIRIVLPDLKYKDSYLSAVKEYKALKSKRIEDRSYDLLPEEMSDEDFNEKVLLPLHEAREGINLPKGYVPSTDFWIIDSEGYAGRVSLRHGLTPSLLKHGGHIGYGVVPSKRGRGYAKQALFLVLEKASELGIQEALMTCDEDNEASKKTILNALQVNGGRTDNAVLQENGVTTLRFWVKCRPENT